MQKWKSHVLFCNWEKFEIWTLYQPTISINRIATGSSTKTSLSFRILVWGHLYFRNRVINNWNSLPSDIVCSESLAVFKNKLKRTSIIWNMFIITMFLFLFCIVTRHYLTVLYVFSWWSRTRRCIFYSMLPCAAANLIRNK